MKEILMLVLLVYFLILLFSSITSIFRFFIDVGKWHDREERVKIVSSACEADLIIDDKEVEDIGRDTGDSGDRTVNGIGDISDNISAPLDF